MKELTDRQHEILDAALALISEKGIQGLTTKNLARRIQLSEPALYRHYKNKTDILVSLLVRYRQTLMGIAENTEASSHSPVEKIGLFFRSVFTLLSEQPALTSIIFAEEIFRNEKKLTRAVMEVMAMAHQRLVFWLKEATRQKQLQPEIPTEHLVYLLMGVHRLLVTRWRMHGFAFDLLAEQKAMWKSIIQLIKVKETHERTHQ